MQFTSESITDDVIEQTFNVSVKGESVPGVIWIPTDLSKGYPVVLMGDGSGHHKKIAYLVDLAHKYVRNFGFAVVAIDAPGHGERMSSEQGAQFAAELQKKLAEGQPVEELVTKEMARLGMQAVPEWQATLGAVQALDYIGTEGPVGYWGISMAGAIGVYLLGGLAVLGITVNEVLRKVEKTSRKFPSCITCGRQMEHTPVPNVLPDAVIRYLEEHQLTTVVVSRYVCPKGHYRLWYVPRFGQIEKAFFLKEEM